MKIGFTLPHMGEIATPENIAYAARFGDTEGFDSLWVLDRTLYAVNPQSPYPAFPDGSWPDVYKTVMDPIETLTYVAGITSRIKLATGIIAMLYQNPLILANRLAALDNLSKGRLLLGLGVGHSIDEFQAVDVPFENRGERSDEFLQVLDKIWYDSTVEHSGKYYNIPKSIIGPKPYQAKIPIYLGGFSQKALDRIVSSESKGWIGIPSLDIESFKQGRDALKKTARLQRRVPDSIEFLANVFPEVTREDLSSDRMPMNGSIKQIVKDIKELEELGITHINISFDFGSHSQNLNERLEYAKQIRDSIVPSVLTPEIPRK